MRDWCQYPQIFSIGKIPVMGDLYYDGVLDAHNREFFITREDEIWYDEGRNSYESLYFAFKMDSVLSALIEQHHKNGHGAYMAARFYAENHLIPYGILLERHLDRSRDAQKG